jgi:hypothetical protein
MPCGAGAELHHGQLKWDGVILLLQGAWEIASVFRRGDRE